MSALLTLCDEIEAKAKAATPGPFRTDENRPWQLRGRDGYMVAIFNGEDTDDRGDKANASAHAAAVNAAPTLIEVVRAAVASREAARKYHDAILNGDDSDALYAPYMDAEVAMFAAIDRAEAEAAR